MLSRFNLRFLTFSLLFCMFSFGYAQNYNLEEIWINNNQYYTGTISTGTALQIKFKEVKQSAENKNIYNVSGYSTVRNNTTPFRGLLSITGQAADAAFVTVVGDYLLTEEGSGKHTGRFSGDFKIIISITGEELRTRSHLTEFTGTWRNNDGTLDFKTNWKNQLP